MIDVNVRENGETREENGDRIHENSREFTKEKIENKEITKGNKENIHEIHEIHENIESESLK